MNISNCIYYDNGDNIQYSFKMMSVLFTIAYFLKKNNLSFSNENIKELIKNIRG